MGTRSKGVLDLRVFVCVYVCVCACVRAGACVCVCVCVCPSVKVVTTRLVYIVTGKRP